MTKLESLPNVPQNTGLTKPLNYCPKCGTKTQTDAQNCLSCGRDLAQQYMPGNVGSFQLPLPKRPTGITIICVLWFFGGLINFFGGLGTLGDNLNLLPMLNDFPSDARFWASWAIPLDTVLVVATVFMGLLQFATIYGLWNRKNWAYKYAIALPAGFALTNWVETLLLMAAPASLGAWPDITTVIFSTIIAAIVISYLKKERVKKYLGGE